MTLSIDLDRLRLDVTVSNVTGAAKPLPTRRRRPPFLKGPVPLSWLMTAGKLPGKAMHVAVYLWFRLGLTDKVQVKLGNEDLMAFGVLPDAARRAVKALERAGLVSAVRHAGRKTVVTILQKDGGADPDTVRE